MTFVTLFLSVTLYITLALLDRELVRQTGYNTLSLQMVSAKSDAQKILDAFGPRQRLIVESALAVDFAFMFLGYGMLFFAVSRLLDSSILSFVSFLPVVFDSTENFMHLFAVMNYQPDIVTASYAITVLKFVFLAVYLVLLAITFLLRVLRKRNERA